jgi:hypothetical protein
LEVGGVGVYFNISWTIKIAKIIQH